MEMTPKTEAIVFKEEIEEIYTKQRSEFDSIIKEKLRAFRDDVLLEMAKSSEFNPIGREESHICYSLYREIIEELHRRKPLFYEAMIRGELRGSGFGMNAFIAAYPFAKDENPQGDMS